MRGLAILSLLTLVLGSTAALAAGFELRQASSEAMSTAYAGATATNSNSTDLFYNPASLEGAQNWDASPCDASDPASTAKS